MDAGHGLARCEEQNDFAHPDGNLYVPGGDEAAAWKAQLHQTLRVVDGSVVRKGTGGEDGYSALSVRDPQSGTEAPTGRPRRLRQGNRP